jgi:hypothetical protein
METHGIDAERRLAGDFIGQGLPRTFDTWLERHRLATLTFQAVAEVAWLAVESIGDGEVTPDLPSEKMMVLITYCYATGVFDSAEIVATIPRDAILRDICAGMRPTEQSIRQFRWAHSHAIIRALSRVLRNVSAYCQAEDSCPQYW